MDVSEDRRRRDESWDAETIRRLRRHAGLSQQALAEELNARQQTVSEWERGAYAPRGTAARLLTRVAEDVAFPFRPGDPGSNQDEGTDEDDEQT
ncbi:MAG: helix-turn-helix domain-containing protein [Chloroflexi bacterium]|nr:helix-turn-helix domain-containing protein [Chloroflexota bacterium]